MFNIITHIFTYSLPYCLWAGIISHVQTLRVHQMFSWPRCSSQFFHDSHDSITLALLDCVKHSCIALVRLSTHSSDRLHITKLLVSATDSKFTAHIELWESSTFWLSGQARMVALWGEVYYKSWGNCVWWVNVEIITRFVCMVCVGCVDIKGLRVWLWHCYIVTLAKLFTPYVPLSASIIIIIK